MCYILDDCSLHSTLFLTQSIFAFCIITTLPFQGIDLIFKKTILSQFHFFKKNSPVLKSLLKLYNQNYSLFLLKTQLVPTRNHIFYG